MLLRRSASLLSRMGAAASATAAEAGGGAWAPQSAAALQLLDRWQHCGDSGGSSSGQGGGSWQHGSHTSMRHLSLRPGGGGKQQAAAEQQPPDSLAAAGEDFGNDVAQAGLDAASSSAGMAAADSAAGGGWAAAASATPGVADLFTASAIVAAAAGAEEDALAAAREDSWLPTRLIQGLLTGLHGALGLEWWQSIMVATCAMRLATLPIMIMQIKNTYRMSLARPEMEVLMNHVKEEQAKGNMEAALEHQQHVMAVWKKYNCNPFKSMAGMLVQAPIFIGFFSALRGFAAHKVPSLTEGGALWFTDLTVADPTYMLPALAGLSFLLTIELGAADGMQGQPPEMQKKLKNVMRVVALVIPLASTALPASVFMYWSASNVFSLLQTSLLKVPLVKSTLGIPDLSKLRQPSQAELVGKPVQTFTHQTRPRKLPKLKRPQGEE